MTTWADLLKAAALAALYIVAVPRLLAVAEAKSAAAREDGQAQPGEAPAQTDAPPG